MNNDHCLSRRAFLSVAAAMATAPASLALPKPAIQEFRRGGMVYRRLGQTDLHVSLLSFGSHTDPAYKRPAKHGMTLSDEGQARRDRQISQALDLGVNLVDTYENEGQWEPMARLVRSRRDKVLISLCRQFPMFVGENIDRAAKLFGHVDLYRIYLGDGPGVTDSTLEDWEVLRTARELGKVRTIGISTHSESMMRSALKELEGLDYIMFPYNFIHARADYSEFLPEAIKNGVGLIAIKPLAAGSIVTLDPLAKIGSKPENERVELYQARNHPLLPAVTAELTKSLNRLPDETLCQAALRFVYSRPFISSAMPGMFDDGMVGENHAALTRHLELARAEVEVLRDAKQLAGVRGRHWLPQHYRWLDQRWKA
jgi:aryl-alcohol dehydrogenase-like predicted oxidoreductase